MPFIYLGITRYAGTSKKSGSAYDIAVVHYADDASNTSRPDRKQALGLEGKTIAISPDAINQFQRLEPLTVVNFEFEPDPRNMERNRVCGFKPVPKAVQQQAS
ncbi:CTX phage RstB protein [compost metagenome]